MPKPIRIVIPCYNEEKRLPAREVLEFVRVHENISLIMVNDGSTDQTGPIIDQLSRDEPEKIFPIHLETNVGKAEAVRTGLLKACQMDSEYVGFWDADLSTPLDEIHRLISYLERNAMIEAVFGVRVLLLGRHIKRRAYRHYIGRVFATIFSFILDIPVYDTQCGAKIFRATPKFNKVISDPFLTQWLFDVEMLARLINFSEPHVHPGEMIREEPLLEWRHVEGSKIGFDNFFQILSETSRLWRNYRNPRRMER